MVLLTTLAGCKVVDAPETLEDLMVFGFETFGDDDSMLATLDNLVPLVEQNEQDLIDGVRVGELTNQHLATVGIDAPEESSITGAMGLVTYRNPIAPVVEVISDPDKEQYFDNMDSFDPEDRGDRQCFLDHECPSFEQYIEETVTVVVLGRSERKYTNEFQWVEHDELGSVVAIRSLSPDPIEFGTSLFAVHQQYGLAWLIPEGGGARRVEAFWIDGEVLGALDVPDSFAVDSAVSGMRRTAATIDDIIEGIE